eukprot:CAMPEP_0180686962 /NCGR_PEP_ID=MMETSP1037_2-20121125/73206_1 /TAXON_ID=632150 /ORGANISM="Azadinium spinosum, Strain 3D9" /LENGTH=111 /DNA_ID=CAMNT_0022717729 /DNA_START=70 /DNA_END=405 /DNA_ORIENTATION=-
MKDCSMKPWIPPWSWVNSGALCVLIISIPSVPLATVIVDFDRAWSLIVDREMILSKLFIDSPHATELSAMGTDWRRSNRMRRPVNSSFCISSTKTSSEFFTVPNLSLSSFT